jgi:hypothetical protein
VVAASMIRVMSHSENTSEMLVNFYGTVTTQKIAILIYVNICFNVITISNKPLVADM